MTKLEVAMAAINNVFSDTSVSKEKTKEDLETLLEEIREILGTMSED